jgi:hypothetical protein
VKRKGVAAGRGSEGSAERNCDSMKRNRIQGRLSQTSGQEIAKSVPSRAEAVLGD